MGWRLNSLLDSMMEDFIATPLSGWVRKLPKPLMLWIWSCLMLSLSQVMPLPTWQSRIPHWAYPAIWIVVVIWSTGPFLSFEIFLKIFFSGLLLKSLKMMSLEWCLHNAGRFQGIFFSNKILNYLIFFIFRYFNLSAYSWSSLCVLITGNEVDHVNAIPKDTDIRWTSTHALLRSLLKQAIFFIRNK